MSRDLAHLAFFYTFFSISLVCIGFFFFFYLSMQIFALDNMRKRERDVMSIS